MRKNGVFLFLSWAIFGISMAYVGEYIISRPMDEFIQLICVITSLMLAVTLIKKTADFFNKFLN